MGGTGMGGTATLPAPDDLILTMQDLSDHELNDELVHSGSWLYGKHCMHCHGINAVGSTVVSDLRYSGMLPNIEIWQSVVKDGVLESSGMPGFGPIMNAEEIESIRQYVVRQNQLSVQYGDTTRIGR